MTFYTNSKQRMTHTFTRDKILKGQKESSKGIALIELLCVIGIIIILAGLFLPSLLNARRKAQYAKCLVNLRQLVTAVGYYGEDYRAYPDISPGDPDQPYSGEGGNGKLITLLRPYVSSEDSFLCPTNTTEVFGPNPEGIRTSFKYN